MHPFDTLRHHQLTRYAFPDTQPALCRLWLTCKGSRPAHLILTNIVYIILVKLRLGLGNDL